MKECKCTMSQRVLGDGCDVCNPEFAIELYKENISELEEQLQQAQAELASYKAGVEVEAVATLSDSQTRAEVWLDELPYELVGQRVRVLVRAAKGGFEMSESFEKWYKNKGYHIMFNDVGDTLAKQSYTAGLLRAAEIAELMTRECPSPDCSQCDVLEDCIRKETGFCIAAVIRKEAGE